MVSTSKQVRRTPSGEVRPTTRNRPSDDELLDACLAEMARVGDDRTTMDGVAALVPTTKATLYAHFGSRERLLTAAVDRELEIATRRLYAAYDENWEQRPEPAVRAAIVALFDYARDRPDGFRALLATTHVTNHGHSGSDVLSQMLEQRVEEWIRTMQTSRGRSAGAGRGAAAVAAICVGIPLSLARNALTHGFDLTVATRLATDATLHALRGLAPADLQSLDQAVPGTATAPEA